MLPKLHKPPKLKPLALGDVMVAFINQDKTPDRTSQYKQYLGHHWAIQDEHINNNHQDKLVLPEFAIRQCSQQQILDYHIQNKIRQTDQYEVLLGKVDARIKIAMEEYGGRLKEGEEGIQDLMTSLETLCCKIRQSRQHMVLSLERVKKSYMKVAPTLRKINNISKVIDILSVWGKSKIPYLFSLDLAQPHLYDLKQLLELFKQAQQNILSNPTLPKSQSLRTMLASLQQKQKNLIASVCAQIMSSIISYSSKDEYSKKFSQYIFIRENGHCNDIFTQQGIKQVLIANSKQIFYSVLSKLTPNLNPDMLNQTIFLEFYQQVMEEYILYFKNWHFVTTYHLQQSTAYSQLFLQNRKNVFFIFCHQLAEAIEASNKFISLQYKVKLQLVQKLQDFLEAGQKWMGTYENMQLPKVVTTKLSAQLQRIFTLYNNLIKNILSQQISVTALENVDESRPLHKVKSTVQVDGINYAKVSAFLCSGSSNSRIHAEAVKNNLQELPEAPEVRLKIGQVFAQMIIEYLERSKYLESNKAIYLKKILEHFQFIMFMLYQVCVRDYLKQRLTTNIIGEIQQNQTQKSEETASISWKTLNDLSKSLMFKKKYSQIVQFLQLCDTKYDGIKIAGIIDVNKVFQSNNSNITNGYMKIIIRVVSDLRKIFKWLIEILPKTQMKGLRQVNKIAKLQNVLMEIFGLILQNNLENVSKKYIDVVSPVILKLKWEIKKFNQETANLYKQYKMKVLQAFRSTTLFSIVQSQCPELGPYLSDQQMQTLYRSLLDLYGRIQKINDNGRQLIRMDCVEIGKILNDIGVKSDIWADWFDKYLDLTSQRSYKTVLERMTKIGVLYEPVCWRYALMWIVGDMSTRQKKQYHGGLARLYMDFLGR